MSRRKQVDPDELLQGTAHILEELLARLRKEMSEKKGFNPKLAISANHLSSSVAKLHGELRQAGKANMRWAASATVQDKMQLIVDIFEDFSVEHRREVLAQLAPAPRNMPGEVLVFKSGMP